MLKKLVLDHGHVHYVDHMGDDVSVVNAARVSFDKQSDEFKEKDIGLINYLAKHGHWTPFAHGCITVRIKMPLFVARQWFKSTVGIAYNEVSRRYVKTTPEFYRPDVWRRAPDGNIKQGSGSGAVYDAWLDHHYNSLLMDSMNAYDYAIDKGVAPEQARIMLPQAMYTEFVMTASLAAMARVVGLRVEASAQWEIQQYGKALSDVVEPLFPASWAALRQGH